MRVVITGIAGFIGAQLARALRAGGARVAGIDNFDATYTLALKRARVAHLLEGVEVVEGDLCDPQVLDTLVAGADAVVHLAARVGVRGSVDDPGGYVATNVGGTVAVLEAARRHGVGHVLFASSSSVYGATTRWPAREDDPVDSPVSVYAASKRAAELVAHATARLHGLPVTAARLFTVYGPWGRPDMAVYGWTQAIFEGRDVVLYNGGAMERDFTYIDDVVQALVALLARTPTAGASGCASDVPFRIVNVGNTVPVPLRDVVEAIEAASGHHARVIEAAMQQGDVVRTWADDTLLAALVGPRPPRPIALGIQSFVDWYTSIGRTLT